MKKRNYLLFVLIAILAAGVGVYTSYQHAQPQAVQQTPEARAVANLFAQTMPDAAGKPQALSQWKGKPLIINFWATWCAPCVEEMPELAALQAEVAPVQIIGIGVDSQENIAQFAEKFHIYYPLYVAGTGATDLLRQFGNQAGGLPFTVLVGLDGNLKKVYLGRLNFDELRRDLASLKNM
ncbi:alkyl hydroperoxide reductase [Herbaspirillum hiltneri N3]|uniref:Alkyl hydroperoxide reductase n=1 Tax=Herbaspirillum hiltneri N3 TaxID=1262470 RepID=A0ABN4HTB6_9BURK|nr:TlpA disulfide reductase family protein [Herbaspirillum hiltneri]AKZ61397.1 alkyl hydroperoxide reductase [Herbaspirillum hiltneri N3]